MYAARRLLTSVVLHLCCAATLAGVVSFGLPAPSANGEKKLTKPLTPLHSRSYKMQDIPTRAVNYAEAPVNENQFQNNENRKVFFPAGIQEEIVPGASLWELSVKSHRDNNAHHNYATSDRAVAQEIGLDFFSSALVSCLLVDVPITAGKIKRARTSIRTWPNYVKGSPTVKEGIALVGEALFRHYYATEETKEDDIPSKPYDVDVARARNASDRLLKAWSEIIGNDKFADGKKIKEYEIFFELVYYLKNNDQATCENAWEKMLPLMLTDTELGKWMNEVDYHKKLVVDFHEYSKNTTGYQVTDTVAAAHDNDKYIPFNLLAYTLKWYYGDTGIVE